MGERRGMKGLELWCKKMTEGYPGVKVENMTTSWRDGLAFCAIIHHFHPELIDFSKLNKNDVYKNNELAFTVAEQYLGIPALLEPADMVQYTVPDRLSILTYLSQFYQTFAVQNRQTSSPARIPPRRPASAQDRGIVSPASTSPPTKMMLSRGGTPVGIPRREPCHGCGQPVYIAERLTVSGLLYHRTCFRCARCGGQLTLASYYETETGGQYCCEICPDEQSKAGNWQEAGGETVDVQSDGQVSAPSVWEEAKADAQKLWEQRSTEVPMRIVSSSLSDEEKSAGLAYQTAQSDVFSDTSQPSKSRAHFITALLDDNSDEQQPPLPNTKPPDLGSSYYNNNNNNRLNNENISDLVVSDVTKESVQGSTSLVQTRMRLFEQNNKKSSVQSVDGSIIVISDNDSEGIIITDDSSDILEDDAVIRTKGNKINRVQSEDGDNKLSDLVESPLRTNKINRVKSEDITESDNKLSSQYEQANLSYVKSDNIIRSEPTLTECKKLDINKVDDKTKPKMNKVKLAARIFESQATEMKLSASKSDITVENETKLSDTQVGELKSVNLKETEIEEINLVTSLEDTRDIEMNLATCTNESEFTNLKGSNEIKSDSHKNASEIALTVDMSLDTSTEDVNLDESAIETLGEIPAKLDTITAEIKSDTRTAEIYSNANAVEIKSDTNTEIKFDASTAAINMDVSTVQSDTNREIKADTNAEEIKSDANTVEIKPDTSTGEIKSDASAVQTQIPITQMKSVTNTELMQRNIDRNDNTNTDLPQITVHKPTLEQITNTEASSENNKKSPQLPVRRLKKPAPRQTPTMDDQKTRNVQCDPQKSTKHLYPDDLNPFGSEPSEDDEDSTYSKSLNPFGDASDDSEEGDAKKSPMPAVRALKKIHPYEKDFKIKSDGDTPQRLLTITARRLTESTNPFGDDDDEDGCDEDVEVRLQKPRPSPRKLVMSQMVLVDVEREGNSLSSISSASEALRRISNNTSFGSIGSLSSISSSGTHSGRKKKAAPRPPIPSFQGQRVKDDEEKSSSVKGGTSPSASVNHSPRPRKSRKAPLPPGTTSTPQQNDGGSMLSLPTATPIKQPYAEAINHLILSPTGSVDSGEYEKEKVIKDEVNRNRQSHGYYDNDTKSFQISPPNKSMYGKWKRKKGQAPARPSIPQKRTIKALPIAEVRRELDLIEIQQQGLERQGVRLEQIIRENCEGPDADPEGTVSIEAEDLILQLFEVVNEKNELCRRQAELMYLQRQHRLEEEHADVEYQIRLLMQVPEANKTDSDKANEEELLKRLVDIVERRNEIVECLEMDRLREAQEDDSISNSMNTYVARREESDTVSVAASDTLKKKKKFKLKKKLKGITGGGKIDKDKDIDEAESSSSLGSLSVKEDKKKKKKKFNLF